QRMSTGEVMDIEAGTMQSASFTLLATEIHDFPDIQKQLSETELFNFLKIYIEKVAACVESYEGFGDNFSQGRSKAIFEHQDKQREAIQSVHAAIAIQNAMLVLNQNMGDPYPHFSTGVGIHTGNVNFGALGSEFRMDLTTMGNAVRIMACVSRLTQQYQCHILISEETFKLLGEKHPFKYREVDLLWFEELQVPLVVYEIFDGDPAEIQRKKLKLTPVFHEGLQLYRDQKWDQAALCFENCARIFPEDHIVSVYLERCQQFKTKQMPDDWGGALKLSEFINNDVSKNEFKTKNWQDVFGSVMERLDGKTTSDTGQLKEVLPVSQEPEKKKQDDAPAVDVELKETILPSQEPEKKQEDESEGEVRSSQQKIIDNQTSVMESTVPSPQSTALLPAVNLEKKKSVNGEPMDTVIPMNTTMSTPQEPEISNLLEDESDVPRAGKNYKKIPANKEKASVIVTNYMLLSMGVSIVPLPVFDTIALGAVQIKMIKALAKLYGVPYSEQKSRAYTGSLLGAVLPISVYGSLGSLVKFVPVVGSVAGAILMPTTAAACSYALGKVFIQHFELGGTLLDFEPETTKAYLTELFTEGKQLVKNYNKDDSERLFTDVEKGLGVRV
ncbi:MAG: DUF697 domain-containing protein, partial [SAR324 cluster bacterium]|nr:DUF697 domain-containing protein [SAR324 cluster bacterium]